MKKWLRRILMSILEDKPLKEITDEQKIKLEKRQQDLETIMGYTADVAIKGDRVNE